MNKGKTEYAYLAIKQKICEGTLAPLSDIVEEALQAELNISRTPIREAVQRLHKEGFVYIYPRKGTIVTEVTRDLVYELYQVRELNEPFVAKQACAFIPREWLLQKREELNNPPQHYEGDVLRRFYIDRDKELHMIMLEYCGNRFLKTIMTIVHDHNHRIRIKISNPANANYDHSVSEHTAIIDALLSKDEDAVERTVLEHVLNSKQISLKYY